MLTKDGKYIGEAIFTKNSLCAKSQIEHKSPHFMCKAPRAVNFK
jgi:hypothetical protein